MAGSSSYTNSSESHHENDVGVSQRAEIPDYPEGKSFWSVHTTNNIATTTTYMNNIQEFIQVVPPKELTYEALIPGHFHKDDLYTVIALGKWLPGMRMTLKLGAHVHSRRIQVGVLCSVVLLISSSAPGSRSKTCIHRVYRGEAPSASRDILTHILHAV